MLEHIEITGEGGIIRLKWEWDDPEIESLDILGKKNMKKQHRFRPESCMIHRKNSAMWKRR